MALIDTIVNITITRQTATAQVASFDGVLVAEEFLIASITPAFGATERVRSYTSLSEIVTAGFATSSAVYLAAAALFSQNPNPGLIYVGRKQTGIDGTETWTEALTAIADESGAWYGFLIGDRTLASLEEAADWAEANKKLMGISDDDANIVDSTGDIAEYINTNNYDRSFVMYHPDADLTTDDPMAEAAWFGKMFPNAPGSANWSFKTLAGVAAYELLTAKRSTALGKECNLYETVAANDVARFGTVGSGEYMDIIRGIDWLEARIQETVFTVLLNNKKVPFTDAGISTVTAAVREALQEAADVELIISANDETNGYTVTAPAAADVSAANKAARTLPDVEFTATLQGAINKVTITGTVSL